MKPKTLDRIFYIGFLLLVAGTILIPVSAWVGGILFYAAIGMIFLTAGLIVTRHA